MQTVLLLLLKHLAVWCYWSYHHLDPVGVIYATDGTVINIDQRIVMVSEDVERHLLYDFYLSQAVLASAYPIRFRFAKPVYIHNLDRLIRECLHLQNNAQLRQRLHHHRFRNYVRL